MIFDAISQILEYISLFEINYAHAYKHRVYTSSDARQNKLLARQTFLKRSLFYNQSRILLRRICSEILKLSSKKV